MKYAVMNLKGGCGKTLIATQIMLGYNCTGIEMDPYGVLNEVFQERVKKVGLREKLPKIPDNCVVDFGGFDHKYLTTVADEVDIIIIPTISTRNNIQATVDTIGKLKHHREKILLIFNMSKKIADIEELTELFEEIAEGAIHTYILPLSTALQTAENEGISIFDLEKKSKIYKKSADTIRRLHQKIIKIVGDK